MQHNHVFHNLLVYIIAPPQEANGLKRQTKQSIRVHLPVLRAQPEIHTYRPRYDIVTWRCKKEVKA